MLQIVQKGEFLDFRKRYQIRIFLPLLPLALPPHFLSLFGSVWFTLIWPASLWIGLVILYACAYALSAPNVCASNIQHARYAMNSNEICTKVYLVQYTNIHIFPFLDLFSFSFSSFVFLLFFLFFSLTRSVVFAFIFFLQQNELKGKRREKK